MGHRGARAREAALLSLRYDVEAPQNRHGEPMALRIVAEWVEEDLP